MSCQISIDDQQLRYLTRQARNEVVSLGVDYISDLLREASRLEAACRVHPGEPEITRTMLKDAALALKRYPTKSRRPWWFLVIQILSTVTTLFVGILFDLDRFQQDASWLYIFVAVLTGAIIFTVVEVILGRV